MRFELSTSSLSIALTALFLSTTATAQTNSRYPKGLYSEGLKVLDPPNLASSAVSATSLRAIPSEIPYSCYGTALSRENKELPAINCAISSLEVFEVTYPDCERSWKMCRCSDADLSREDMMELFGMLSPNLRAQVRNLMAFKTSKSAHAYTSNEDVVVFGDLRHWTVITHEAAHVLDSRKGGLSETAVYEDAIKKDTCTADYYAANAMTRGDVKEPWAQTFVVNTFRKLGGVLKADAGCMQNQLDVVADQTDDFVKKSRCDMSMATTEGPMFERSPSEVLDKSITIENFPASLTAVSPSKTAYPSSDIVIRMKESEDEKSAGTTALRTTGWGIATSILMLQLWYMN
ncbi:hypothetical protein EX30DRAFT_366959 [Ascodesmis nigricans]|uniref:Lysine-specific metallo-endopeptidase domain-containing protein n=1 Tax=Ascodesmis nigricans TaxID=341454 RepID=A0A4S2MJB9_9PEZI|nr:hypothetical protein EX30DRAFT_366959 [Ascodesmis nigricans]